METHLSNIRYSLLLKLHLKSFLVAIFIQSSSKFFVNFIDCPDYIIYMLYGLV